MRLTNKDGTYDEYIVDDNGNCIGKRTLNNDLTHKTSQLEDLMEKYDFETVEELDKFLARNIIFGTLHKYK